MSQYKDENWPMKKMAIGVEDRNEDGVFVARVLAVADGGLRVDIAVSEFIDTEERTLSNLGAYHTKVWLLQRADNEGHPLLRVEGESDEYVKEGVNNVCQYARRVLEDVKKEFSQKEWAHERILAEMYVKDKCGDLSTEVDEILCKEKEDRAANLKRYNELKDSVSGAAPSGSV